MRQARAAGGAAALFADCYGEAPAAIWRAPGRVNLIGEHTDYNDGLVLPFAITAGVTVAAAPHPADVLVVASRQQGCVPLSFRLAELEPGQVTGWAAYVCGVAWALREAGYRAGGARLAIDSDLPQGAGLSSSAALGCAVALALSDLAGAEIPRPALARIAQRAERAFAGVPCGILDQSASLLCERGSALLLDCRSGAAERVPLDPAATGVSLQLIDTRVRHQHASGSYAQRRAECERAARLLGLASLREVADSPDAARLVGGLADPVLSRRAAHVVTENKRVRRAARLLRAGDIAGAAALLTAAHASLRDDFEVSWLAADVTVEAALSAGALGARMTGGGFGGSVIAVVPATRTAALHAEVRAAFRRRGWQQPGFREVMPSAGASLVS